MSASLAFPRALAAGLAILVLLLHTPAVAAQGEPEGFPDPGAALVDPDFKVATREFGLDRRVEMYQWRYADGRFERVWHAALIDPAGLDAAHANPPRFPLENRRWWAEKPTLDGKPLDPAVVRSLGEWRELRPSFSRLPANLAASFQPEGEGLGSAENPLEPEIGDIRITWRELVLPPLAGNVALHDGVWRLVADPDDARPGAQTAPPAIRPQHAQRMWPFFGVGLLAIAGIVVAVRRSRRHRTA